MSSRILIVGMVVAVLLSIVQAAHAEGRRFLRLGVTADGGGYLLASTRGEFYAYGNAHPWPNPTGFTGEITSVAVTANGQGAIAVSSSGQFYAYGNAHPWPNPTGFSGRIVDVAVTGDGQGAIAVSSSGQFYAYGNAHPWPNPTGFTGEITSVAVTANGQGAAALSSIGQVYAYGTVQHRGNGDFGCTRYGGANVCLEIREKYESLGGPRSFLGIPTSHEFPAGGGRGLGMHFQGGSIYWSKETGAHEVRGAIREKWGSLGWENGFLGFPTSDEFSAGGGRGRGNHFQGGSIYWSAPTGAHEVHGAIREKWGSLGWENGFLGFPTSDEYSSYGGQVRVSDFIGGSVYWSSTGGAADYVPASVTGFRSWHSTEPPPGRLLYNYDFAIPSGQAKPIYASPSKAFQLLRACFNCSFPINGAPSGYPIHGQKLPLQACAVDLFCKSAPVTFYSNERDYIRFRALPGHFDGADSTVTFTFYNAADGSLRLHVVGWVVKPTVTDSLNRAFASRAWEAFANTLGMNISPPQIPSPGIPPRANAAY